MNPLRAQDDESASAFSTNMDLYSSYIWRGSQLGQGPSLQPSVGFSAGGFALGVWSAVDFNGYLEADPYVSYTFPFGLSLGLTDYYYPSLPLFDFSDSTGSHALEINAGLEAGGFSLSGNYIVNEAGGAASAGGDMYFEAGYSFERFSIFLGAGDGWHTSDGRFAVCNLGVGTSGEIKITDSFSVPVTGQVIVNPDREQMFVTVGFSL